MGRVTYDGTKGQSTQYNAFGEVVWQEDAQISTFEYDHANPDKFRLPLINGTIPYRFDTVSGGG